MICWHSLDYCRKKNVLTPLPIRLKSFPTPETVSPHPASAAQIASINIAKIDFFIISSFVVYYNIYSVLKQSSRLHLYRQQKYIVILDAGLEFIKPFGQARIEFDHIGPRAIFYEFFEPFVSE